MSRVPEGWRHGSCGEFVTLQRGFDLPVQDREGGDVPVFASNGIVGFHSSTKIEAPCVITGRSGTVGKVFYLESDCWPLNTTLYVRDFHGNDPKFISYFLNGLSLERYSTGTGVPTLNRNVVHKEKVAFPPLPEQKRIAAILSSVDDAIAATEAVIEQTQRVKEGLLQDLLTRGIAHTRFKQTEIGEIPEGWEVVALKDVTVKIQDGNYGADYPKKNEFVSVGIPFLTSKVLGGSGIINRKKFDFITSEKHKLLKKAHIIPNDILFTNRGANVGAIAIVPIDVIDANIGPQLTLMRCENEKIIPQFLFQCLRGQYFQQQVKSQDSGSAMNFFGIKTTEKFKIFLPSLSEQKRIAEILSEVDRGIGESKGKLSQLQQTKRGLMQDLLSGDVRGAV